MIKKAAKIISYFGGGLISVMFVSFAIMTLYILTGFEFRHRSYERN